MFRRFSIIKIIAKEIQFIIKFINLKKYQLLIEKSNANQQIHKT
jgi:hypothetical protein